MSDLLLVGSVGCALLIFALSGSPGMLKTACGGMGCGMIFGVLLAAFIG